MGAEGKPDALFELQVIRPATAPNFASIVADNTCCNGSTDEKKALLPSGQQRLSQTFHYSTDLINYCGILLIVFLIASNSCSFSCFFCNSELSLEIFFSWS